MLIRYNVETDWTILLRRKLTLQLFNQFSQKYFKMIFF